jgi:hypothetical protein
MKIADLFVDIKLGDTAALTRGISKEGEKAGKQAGASLSSALDTAATRAGKSAGAKLSDTITKAAKQITPEIAATIDPARLKQSLDRTAARLADLRIAALVAPEVDRKKLATEIKVTEGRLDQLKAHADVIIDQKAVAGQADKAGGLFSRAFKTGAGAAAGFFATDKILSFGRDMLTAGSDAQQGIGAVESVFQKNAATVERWASQSSRAVGLSSNDYRTLATTLGAALGNMGIAQDQVAGKTNALIKLGADLSATYGGTAADAVEALSAALRGESDPIERYGISVNATKVAAEMAAKGLDKLQGSAWSPSRPRRR